MALQSASSFKLILTRHGQSVYNLTERLGGDSGITADGESYAALLPTVLARLLEGAAPLRSMTDDDSEAAAPAAPRCVEVWTSTLVRTIQTARHLPHSKRQWKALDEIDAGLCDGMTYHEVEASMPEEFAARKRDKLGYRYPGGESYWDVHQRLKPVLAELQSGAPWAGAPSGSALCIVSHQAVLRVLYGCLMGVPAERIPTLDIPLHTLIELTVQADGSIHEQRWPVDVAAGLEQFPSGSLASPASAASSEDASPSSDADEPGAPQPLTDADAWQQHACLRKQACQPGLTCEAAAVGVAAAAGAGGAA